MTPRNIAPSLLLGLLVASVASGQAPPAPAPGKTLSASLGVIVFPAKGQTAEVQSRDEGECYTWAKGETGIDPMAPAPAPAQAQAASPPAQQPQGTAVRGAARGAAAGALIGEVAGDAGKGAEIGATAGLLRGIGEKRRMEAEEKQEAAEKQQQAAQQQQAATQQQREQFNKGFAVCLEAKGYTVK